MWKHRARRIERDGVLVVTLRGSVGRDAEEVGRLLDELDELGAQAGGVEAAVLDVTRFSNAPGDEAGILTSALGGLAACWVSGEEQTGDRWDLPHAVRVAPSLDQALDRIAGWRRAGGFDEVSGRSVLERRWTERGLEARTRTDGVEEMLDRFHRNRLVLRALPEQREVWWPWPDRTERMHEALRREARLVIEQGQVTEVDLSPHQTRRPLPPDWVDRVADLPRVEVLWLLGASPDPDDVVRAARAWPELREVRLDRERITPELASRLDGIEVR